MLTYKSVNIFWRFCTSTWDINNWDKTTIYCIIYDSTLFMFALGKQILSFIRLCFLLFSSHFLAIILFLLYRFSLFLLILVKRHYRHLITAIIKLQVIMCASAYFETEIYVKKLPNVEWLFIFNGTGQINE